MKKLLFLFIAGFGLFSLVISGCKKDQGMTFNPSSPIIIDSFTPSLGGGRTEILINGHNFSSDTSKLQVSIGGKPIKVVAANGNQIMAVIPKKCGSGPVIVTIGSSSTQSVDSFKYIFTHTVSTLAGNGKPGYANGQGTNAQFNFSNPNWIRTMGIVVDDKLNVYVADAGNHCIRKIDSAGNVTTVAGNPNAAGYKDGKGLEAQFSLPYDVAIDKAGNLYTADPGNYDIRKITPDGQATTLFFGVASPWSITVDPTGNTIYYSNCDNPGSIFRVVAPFNSSEKIIGGLNYPAGIRLDKLGNIYASINGGNVITRFTAGTWAATDVAGLAGNAAYVNGVGSNARFSLPWGIGLDSADNIYVAGNGTWNGGNNADQSIRLIQQGSWLVSTFAGSGTPGYTEGIGGAASFSGPGGVAVDKNGTVYVLDKNNNAIRKIVSE